MSSRIFSGGVFQEKEKKVRTSVQIDPLVRKRIRLIAAHADLTFSDALRHVLRLGLKSCENSGVLVGTPPAWLGDEEKNH